MNIFTSWYFYVLLVGVIGFIIGLILVFTLSNKIIAYVLIGLGIILIILGIVFWVMDAKKPKIEEEKNLENLIAKAPIIGGTLSESYKQAKTQGIPVLKQQFSRAGDYAKENKLGQGLTGAVLGSVLTVGIPVGTVAGGYLGKKLIVS